MTIVKVPPRGGSGGRRGHSGMEHRMRTAEVKVGATRAARSEAKRAVADGPADQVEVLIEVALTAATASDAEDAHVAGTYLIRLDTRLPRKKWASAALDVFHESVAIGVLDDYEFTVRERETNAALEQDPLHEDYSLSARGDFGGQVE